MKKFLLTCVLLLTFSVRAEVDPELPPNELGKVMVLMYHVITPLSPTASKSVIEWTRTPDDFRKDLELLYEKNYYLVNLVDLVNGLEVPRGKTPVVLTFDDAAKGQFSQNEGKWDPDCAVGMIQTMYEQHPDFGRAGSFYLNPSATQSDSPKLTVWSSMLKEMVDMGFELGNHTVTHPKLKSLSQAGVAKEIAGVQTWIDQNIPGYQMQTLAMPFGIYPQNAEWAANGESGGVKYRNVALLEVGANPAPSPYSMKFNPLHIPRVRAGKYLVEGAWTGDYFYDELAKFDRNPETRFVSDGDPNTVTVPENRKAELRGDLAEKELSFIP